MILKKNVKLMAPKPISPWRKISLGTWRPTSDSSVYSSIEVEVSKVNELLSQMSVKTGKKLKMSHFVGLICAKMLKNYPHLNSIIRFGQIYPRADIDLFFHVATDSKGEDLSGTVIRSIDQLNITQISEQLNSSSESIRSGMDKTFEQSKKTIGMLPGIMMKPILDLLGFIMYSLNLWTPALGSPQDAFGSMMITNIGALGAHMAYVPIAAYSRVPLILCMGKVQKKPVVKSDAIEIGNVMNLSFTFDHRIIDGVVAAKMGAFLEEAFNHPEKIISLN